MTTLWLQTSPQLLNSSYLMPFSMHEKLIRVGLTKTEAKIYVMLLDITKAQAGVLSRKTGIHRRSMYDALDRLIEKGLVSYIVENGKRYYIAADPKRVQELIDEQREDVYQVLPLLQAKFREHKDKQETMFYRGKEGIKTIFEDQLATGKGIDVIGASEQAEEILPYYFFHYKKRRVQKKLLIRAIYGGKSKSSLPSLVEARYLPSSFSTLVSTYIYGPKVAIVIWLVHDPVAIVIQQPDVSATFKNYFTVL